MGSTRKGTWEQWGQGHGASKERDTGTARKGIWGQWGEGCGAAGFGAHLARSHPARSRNTPSACPRRPSSPFSFFSLFSSAAPPRPGSRPLWLRLRLPPNLLGSRIEHHGVGTDPKSPFLGSFLPASRGSGTSTAGTGVPGRSVSIGSEAAAGSGEEGLAELLSVAGFPSKGLG